jgi:hypothetical protein
MLWAAPQIKGYIAGLVSKKLEKDKKLTSGKRPSGARPLLAVACSRPVSAASIPRRVKLSDAVLCCSRGTLLQSVWLVALVLSDSLPWSWCRVRSPLGRDFGGAVQLAAT